MKAYAGIGSRETPHDVLCLMYVVAQRLGAKGWRLRSGHAEGADYAFEQGAADFPADIFLPWNTFNRTLNGSTSHGIFPFPQPEAYPIAEQFHPAWGRLNSGAQALHARNVHQILGPDVTDPDPSRFVICWTMNAAGKGGTGQALRIARHYEIPIFDLADRVHRSRLERLS